MTMQSDAPPVSAIAPPTPPRMRAAVQEGVELRLAPVEQPVPVLHEVLVHVVAAGVRAEDFRFAAPSAVLGQDFSGVVVRAPYEAFRLRPGDEVYGVTAVPRSSGSFAEFTAVPAMQLALKPSVLSHAEAAAVPSAALAAWGTVVELAKAHEGQRMLVLGGSNGAGRLAVQLARYFGAEVSDGSEDGPVQDLDVVIDLDDRFDEDRVRWIDALRPGGLLIVAGGEAPGALHRPAEAAGIRMTGFAEVPDCATLTVVGRLIDSGDLTVASPEVVPFDRIDDARVLLVSDAAHGPIVVQITDY